MGARGPKKGALNAGRPKPKFTPDEWNAIAVHLSHHAKISEICEAYHVTYDVLARMVRDEYAITLPEYVERHQSTGKLKLRTTFWEMVETKKYPILMMYAAGNYLKTVNTNQITVDDTKDKKDNKLLESILDGFKKLTDKKPQTLTQINNFMQSPPLELGQPSPPKCIPCNNITDAEIQQVVDNTSPNDSIDVDNMLITCEQNVDKSVLLLPEASPKEV